MQYSLRVPTADAEIQGLVRQLRELTAASPGAWTEVELTFPQLRALFVLKAQQPMRVSDFADALGMSIAGASALRKRLARLGYVTRQPGLDDQRTVLLALSVRGAHVLDRLEGRSTARLSHAIRRMTEMERAALKTSLRAFLRLRAGKLAPRALGRA